MSKKQVTPADIIKLAVAAARAAAGEYTGLAMEGARYSCNIIGLIIIIVIGTLLLFTTFVYAASKQIPGFEMLYEIGRRINPPSDETPDTDTGQEDSSDIILPSQIVKGAYNDKP